MKEEEEHETAQHEEEDNGLVPRHDALQRRAIRCRVGQRSAVTGTGTQGEKTEPDDAKWSGEDASLLLVVLRTEHHGDAHAARATSQLGLAGLRSSADSQEFVTERAQFHA